MKIIHSSSSQNTSLWKYWLPSLFSSSQYLWVCLLFGFAHGLKSFVQWIFPWLQAPRLVLICIRVSYNIDVVLFQKSEHLPHCRLQEATLAGPGRLQPWCDTPMLSLPPCCPLCTHNVYSRGPRSFHRQSQQQYVWGRCTLTVFLPLGEKGTQALVT